VAQEAERGVMVANNTKLIHSSYRTFSGLSWKNEKLNAYCFPTTTLMVCATPIRPVVVALIEPWKALGALEKKLLWTLPTQSLHGSPTKICHPVGEWGSRSKPGFTKAGPDGAGWVVTVVTAAVSTVLVSVSVACDVLAKGTSASSAWTTYHSGRDECWGCGRDDGGG
jgi:hypothetical protein